MVIKTIYKCGVCGQEWDVEQDARKCEASHMDAEFITGQSYLKTDKYPNEVVLTMENGHKLAYRYYKPVIVEPSDNPYFTNINVSRDVSTNQVIMTALGNRIPEHDDFTWIVLCDETRIPVTSNTPTVILSDAASHIHDIANLVKVSVSTPNIEAAQFVVKDEVI